MSANRNDDVSPLPSPGESAPPPSAPEAESRDVSHSAKGGADSGRVRSRDATVGPVPSPGVPSPHGRLPRRLRRLHRLWPDRDGNISYLLTICVDSRVRVLDNEETFQRLVAFLLDSPDRYYWFGRRFVLMPDHIHVIAHMGDHAIRLGQWIKSLKAVVGGLKRRGEFSVDGRAARVPGLQEPTPSVVSRVPSRCAIARNVPNAGSGDPAYKAKQRTAVGRVPSRGAPHEFTRIKHGWRWQDGYHDHKFRTPESESRKWEYVCLNPVRYGLVKHPEEWPYGGEIFYDCTNGPQLVRGTPPLLESGMLIEEENDGEQNAG